MTTPTWRRCGECGAYNQFAFYNPSAVYCESCDTKVGETDVPVRSDLAALVDDTVIHPDSNDVLAHVEWWWDQ